MLLGSAAGRRTGTVAALGGGQPLGVHVFMNPMKCSDRALTFMFTPWSTYSVVHQLVELMARDVGRVGVIGPILWLLLASKTSCSMAFP